MRDLIFSRPWFLILVALGSTVIWISSTWAYQPVIEVSLWTFPPNGAVPPNVKPLIRIGGHQDELSTEVLWQSDKPLLELERLDGRGTVALSFKTGREGLAEAVPATELEPETHYRLRLTREPKGWAMEELARAAAGVVWYVSLPVDHEPARWAGRIKIEKFDISVRLPWMHPAPVDHRRAVVVRLPVADPGGGPLHLFWTAAPLNSPRQVVFRYHQKVEPTVRLCCFPKDDRLVRFEVRDAAGHLSSPKPNMIAFGN